MKVHQIMTAHARCVGPENTLVEAAGLMRELDVGALPVCEEDRLAGMVTDRDLALRGVANGRDPNTTSIRDVMSTGAVCVFADQEVEEVARLMENRQIRRLPVLNREKRLVGIVSLGDIAISSNPAFSGMALRDVSEPTNPTARQRRLSEHSQTSARFGTAATPRRPAGKRQRGESGTRRRPQTKRKATAAAGKTKSPTTGGTRKPARKPSARGQTRTR